MYQKWGVFFGVFSMLLFQVEQWLVAWVVKHEDSRPYTYSNYLPLLARVERQLYAWKKTRENVVFYIPIFRGVAFVLGLMSLVFSVIND